MRTYKIPVMRTYKITVWNAQTNSDVDYYEFEAVDDEDAIEELNSNFTPQETGKEGKYELTLFENDRFITLIKKETWT